MPNFFKGLRSDGRHWGRTLSSGTEDHFEIDDFRIFGSDHPDIVLVIFPDNTRTLGFTSTRSRNPTDHCIWFSRRVVQDRRVEIHHFIGKVTAHDPVTNRSGISGRRIITDESGTNVFVAATPVDDDWLPTRPPSA